MTAKVVLAIAIASLSASALAQTPPSPAEAMAAAMREQAKAPVAVKSLRGGAYEVTGGTSNTGFIVGDTGVIAIDPQMLAPVAQREQAAIAQITPKPVNVMILTHADPDHVNGLPGWPSGMRIIAHENAAAEIRSYMGDPNVFASPPPPEIKDYLPTETIRFSKDEVLDGVRVRLIHLGPAHTDGDVVVYLPDQKIVYAGDLVVTEGDNYPSVHVMPSGPHKGMGEALNKHGSSLGWIKTVKAILALDADIYVGGHGPVLTKAELQARLDAAVVRRAQIKAMFDQGMTLDQVKAELHEPAVTPGRFPSFTETTYQELTYE